MGSHGVNYSKVSKSRAAEVLDHKQTIFLGANRHESSQLFRDSCRYANDFYNGGLGQWLYEDIQTLIERGQLPITVNFTQRFVDSLSGVEIQSRYRTSYRSDSQHQEDEEYVKVMSHLGFRFQEKNSVPYLQSLKFRDAINCGIGWTNTYKEDGVYKCEHVNSYNVIPDPDDLTPQYTNSRFVCRKRWISPFELSKFNVDAEKILGDLPSCNYYQEITSAELMDRESSFTDVSPYLGANTNRLLLVEIQEKEKAKGYRGLDRRGHQFETFDLEMAEKIADNKREIDEFPTCRIMRTLFLGDHLIEHTPLDPDFPNPTDFSYIPYVWKRAFRTGVPYGIVQLIESIQRDCNARVTAAVHALNSERIIFEGTGMDGKPLAKLKHDMKKKSALIMLPKDSKYQFISNASLAQEQIAIVKEHFDFAQRILGVNDEMMGIESNATSAVSQKERKFNSVRNNVFAYDALAEMKKREAEYFLRLVQASYDENIAVKITEEEQSYYTALNLVVEDDKGGYEVLHNINNIPMSVYVEEVPDYKSSREEAAENLNALLSNPNGLLFALSPALLKRLNMQDGENISKELVEAMKTKMMIESGQFLSSQQQPQQGQEGMPMNMQQGPQDLGMQGGMDPQQLLQGTS